VGGTAVFVGCDAGIAVFVGRGAGLLEGDTATDTSHARAVTIKIETNKRFFFN
jgi:hypothetical protein